jgi:hypothetical protein
MALTYVHADRYFGHYRGKNGHMASTREPTRLTLADMGGQFCCDAWRSVYLAM